MNSRTVDLRTMAAAIVLALASACAWAQDKVVYHITDAQAQALAALRNLRNHLDVDPSAQITVVTLTPSGVVRQTKLQLQGYAYLKP